MKTLYNTYTTGLLLFSIFLSPSIAFAQEKKVRAPESKNFCSRVDSIGAKIAEQVSGRTVKVAEKRTERLAKLADDRSKRDEKRATSWGAHDVSRDARIQALRSRAGNETQKNAVAQFESAVKRAVEKRRIAINAAVQTYRAGIDGLVSGRMANIDGSSTTLKQAIEKAIAAAKIACTGPNPDADGIRTTFTSTVKRAHDIYQSTRSESAIRTEITILTDIRKRSVDAAVLQFKTDIEKATHDLKAAFAQ